MVKRTSSPQNLSFRKKNKSLLDKAPKRILWVALFFLVITTASAYLLHLRGVWEFCLPRIVEKQIKGVQFNSFKIGHFRLRSFRQLSFNKVDASILFHDRQYLLRAEQIDINLARGRWMKEIMVKGRQATLRSKDGEVQARDFSTAVDLSQSFELKKVEGDFNLGSLIYGPYEISDLIGFFELDEGVARLRNCRWGMFGGDLNGEARVRLEAGQPFAADIKFEKVNAQEVVQKFPDVLKDLSGKVDGHFYLEGRNGRLTKVRSDMMAPFGAEVHAAFFAQLLNYIPQSQERNKLQRLIKVGGRIDLQEASLKLQNITDRDVTMVVKLSSEDLNLDVNLKIDLSVDGGINSLLDKLYQSSR